MEDQFMTQWLAEEKRAFMCGWDFSHLDGRMEEETLPWDFRQEILAHLTSECKLLDVDTGGGEFLRSLSHPPEQTAATEGYEPNVEFCRRELCPLGIDFRPGRGDLLPFEGERFDLVINRHGDWNVQEIFRVLKPGGLFLTQQVGADNDRELVSLLLGDLPLPFSHQRLEIAKQCFADAGFRILRGEEFFGKIRFFDVGALVWFAKIIQWEFPDFSVRTCEEALRRAQALLEERGALEGKTHRFFLAVQKPDTPLMNHYDKLLAEGNDPVLDPEPLRTYMNRWDGEPFLDALKLNSSSRVLEIGVGTGRLALRTAPNCGSFVGIDLAPKTAAQAALNLAKYLHAKVICGDFLTHSFSESFDVIYSSLTFMHISRKEAAIRKIMDLLAPQGRVVLSLDKNTATVLEGYSLPLFPDDPKEIVRWLRRYGGKNVTCFDTPAATVVCAEK